MVDQFKGVRVPARMRHLDTDHREYPIPYGVVRDNTGRPHFTINDEVKRMVCLYRNLCPICGTKLLPKRWFTGGPASAFNPNGAYIDVPMHRDCMHFAMQVCPYLAAPNYGKRIDAGTLTPEAVLELGVLVDQTMDPTRPKVFVSVECSRVGINPQTNYVKPQRPYSRVEFWCRGKQLSDAEGRALVKPELQPLIDQCLA